MHPVTAPGIQIPSNIAYHSYESRTDAQSKSKKKAAVERDLILHSNSHQSMDYTATAETSGPSKPLVNHFIAIHDPKTGKTQVVEAKKMVVRGVARAKQAAVASLEDKDTKTSIMEARTDLGNTFGTKKARKVLQDRVLNAISPQKKPGEAPTQIDDAGRAILSNVGSIASNMATRDELQAVVDEAKPVPVANLDADEIQDVYDPAVIIGSDILNMVPVREWQELAAAREEIKTTSRYVAYRVASIATNDSALLRLRVLRYLSFVITFYIMCKPGAHGSRRVPPRDKLKEFLAPAPEAVIENIRRKFSEAGTMRKFHVDLLMTHCCALACIVDNFEVDTQNLRDDLRLDQARINAYFHEIGGRVKPVSNKAEGKATHVVRLTLPLEFPKQRHLAPRR